MEKVTLSSKVFTENPLLDEIVYNARQLAVGTVLKDMDKADAEETLDSMRNGDILISIRNGTIKFENFYYDVNILIDLPGMTPEMARYYADHNDEIPEIYRPQLLNKAVQLFTDNYVEYNNYYRMLHGDPGFIEEWDTWEGLWIDTTYIDDSIPTSIDNISVSYKEIYDDLGNVISDYKLIHELSLAQLITLDSNGTLDNIVENETWLEANNLTKNDVSYLLHVGDKSIDYYDARVASKFQMLYCPASDSEEVRNRYRDLLEANRLYMLYTVYSEAYKYRSDYYDNFMMVFLVLQTVIDLIIELPEYLIRRDVFDTRTCKYIFESNGVKYFRDIPLRYQIALVKNLNKLIKYKSTDKCIVDIISIFGFKNIEAFKYYILKDRYLNDPNDLDYYDNTKIVTDEDGTEHVVPDNDRNYDLKFIRVPLLDQIYDNYARKEQNILTYDEVTKGDSYWLGDRDYDTIKSGVKDLDFTVLRSKYYTIEAVIDLAQRNFTLAYFMNILMNNDIDKSALRISLPNISTTKKIELVDAILCLYALGYIYYGAEDAIMDSRAKIAQILGFNLDADLAKIAAYIEENHKGLTLDDLFYPHDTPESERYGFTLPDESEGIYSFEKLREIFLHNRDIYKHVVEVMANPPSKEIYEAYRYLYRSLFIMNMNMEYYIIDNDVVNQYKDAGYKTKFVYIPKQNQYTDQDIYEQDYSWFIQECDEDTLYFEQSDNFDETHEFNLYIFDGTDIVPINAVAEMAYTYTEFLRYKDPSVYNFLIQIRNITDDSKRQEVCVNSIQQIIEYIKDYVDEDKTDVSLDEVFSGLPSVSLDFVKSYIEEVIDFFKSFKIFTHQSSMMYVIDDKYDQYVQMIDWILLNYTFEKNEIAKIEDFVGRMKVTSAPKDNYNIIDKAWIHVNYNNI